LVKAGCLSVEEEIVDATTEEGKKSLKEMEEDAAGTDREPSSSEKKTPAETARDA
jgi:cell division cycle protein 37